MFSERYHKLNDLSWVSTPSKPADEPSYCRIGETQRIEQLEPPNPGNCMERRRKSVCQLDAWYRQPGQLQHVDWRRIPPSSNQHHQTFASRQGRHISSARNPWISTCGLHSYNRIPHKDFFVPRPGTMRAPTQSPHIQATAFCYSTNLGRPVFLDLVQFSSLVIFVQQICTRIRMPSSVHRGLYRCAHSHRM